MALVWTLKGIASERGDTSLAEGLAARTGPPNVGRSRRMHLTCLAPFLQDRDIGGTAFQRLPSGTEVFEPKFLVAAEMPPKAIADVRIGPPHIQGPELAVRVGIPEQKDARGGLGHRIRNTNRG